MNRIKLSTLFASIFKTMPLFVATFLVFVSSKSNADLKCGPIFEIKSGIQIPLISMDQRYRGENRGQYRDPVTGDTWNVKYFSEAEKKAFQLHIKDGVFFDHKGRKMESEFDAESLHFESGLLVIDKNQRIFLLPFEERGKFHHSSLSGGKDVIFAGTAAFSGGRLREFSDNSGHYKPSPDQTIKTLKLLRSKGVQFNFLKVSGKIAQELANTHSLSGKELEVLIPFSKPE